MVQGMWGNVERIFSNEIKDLRAYALESMRMSLGAKVFFIWGKGTSAYLCDSDHGGDLSLGAKGISA